MRIWHRAMCASNHPLHWFRGTDGLDDIRRICAQAKAHLKSKGWLLFEHGYDQAAPVRTLLQQAGFAEVFSARDLAGIERVSGGS